MNVPFSIFIFFFLINKVVNSPALSHLIVTRVGPCLDRKPSEIVTVSEMSLHKEKSGTSFSGPVKIHKNIENGWSFKATMQKCHDIRNLDTCDFYKATAIIKDGCEDPNAKDQDTFKMFAKYVTPRLSCPIKAGSYTVNKFVFFTTGSILITAESKISTSVFGYTYRLEGFDAVDDRIFCLESNLRMVYIRDHDWIGSQKFEKEPSTEVGTKTPATKTGLSKSDDDGESDGAGQTDKEDEEYKDAPSESKVKTPGLRPNDETENESGETKRVSTETKGETGETNDEIDDTKDTGSETKDGAATEGENEKDDVSQTAGEQNETGDEPSETIDKGSDTEDEKDDNGTNKGETRNEQSKAKDTGSEKGNSKNTDAGSETEGETKGSQPQPAEEADENEDDE